MKYTKVEVLEYMPFLARGLYKIKGGSGSAYIESPNGYLKVSIEGMSDYPETFRLITEPEFKVGGYARAVIDCHKDLKTGNIYPVEGPDTDTWIHVKAENGFVDGYLKRHFTPATEAEYLAQEEAKKPWRPKEGDTYWTIGANHQTAYTTFTSNDRGDIARIKTGNCFRIERAAQYFRDNYLKPAFEKYAADYPNISSENK